MSKRKRSTRSANSQRRRPPARRSGPVEGSLLLSSLLVRAEQRTVWLVTWIAGTVANMIGWAGLEAGVAPWLGARRAAIVRIVAFLRRP